MKLLFISDLHLRTMQDNYLHTIDIVEREKPDVLLLGGDYEDLNLFEQLIRDLKTRNSNLTIAFILGNNDEFEIDNSVAKRLQATYLDSVTYIALNEKIVVTGLSRNFSFRQKQWSLQVAEALRRARQITSMLPPNSFRIVLLHELPLDLLLTVKAVKHDLRFNQRIAETAKKVVEILQADLVLVGHLHIPDLPPIVAENVSNKQVVYVLSCLPNSNYVTLNIRDKKCYVEVKNLDGKTVLSKTLRIPS